MRSHPTSAAPSLHPAGAARRNTARAASLGLLAALLAGAATMVALSGREATADTTGARPRQAAAPVPAAAAASHAGAALPAAPLLTSTQWARLQAALAGRADRDAELARILELLAFRRDARALRAALDEGRHDNATQALARRLDAGLAERVARREMSAGEALQVKTGLLQLMLADDTARARTLAEWRHALAQAPAAPDPRDARWQQARDDLLARWRAQGGGELSLALIEQLQAARQRIYDPSPH